MLAAKVGDAVKWEDVPDGALVRDVSTEVAGWWHAARKVNGRGAWVGNDRNQWNAFDGRGLWDWATQHHDSDTVTILALGLTGAEDEDRLRGLVARFNTTQRDATQACADVIGVTLGCIKGCVDSMLYRADEITQAEHDELTAVYDRLLTLSDTVMARSSR